MTIQYRTLFTYLFLTALLAFSSAYAHAAGPRQRILFDAAWRFQIQPDTAATGIPITNWRWTASDTGLQFVPTMAASNLDDTAAPWAGASIGDDVFHGRAGFAWFRSTLPADSKEYRMLDFTSVDDNADVFVNGIKLFHHEGWNDPFEVPIDSAWHKNGPNVVAVLVENTAGAGEIIGPVTLGADPSADCTPTDLDDSRWRTVHLPHDYVVESAIDNAQDAQHGGYTLKVAWYRKTFTLPESDRGKSIWIDFDGVYRNAMVYLNGKLLGQHPSGYTTFRYDLTNDVRFGEKNVIAVRVDPDFHEGWWYEGGGIYRHVWLNIANPMHIAPWGVFVTAKLPEPGPDGAPSAALSISTQLTNSGAPSGCTLTSTVLDASGQSIAHTSIAAGSVSNAGSELAQNIVLIRPHLWSLDSPYLYELQSTLTRDGQTIDETTTPFGVRTIRYDPDKGFFLNGKHVKIQGVCNHQDFAGVGIAVPDSLEYWRVAKLKEMGCNAWRTSHNPPTPELLDACDRLGMLVMDENRHLGDTYNAKSTPNTPYSDLSDLKSMILRDRNHPSIIMWSMCNEEWDAQSTPQGAEIFKAMMDVVRRYDPTRPITCAITRPGFFAPAGIAFVEDLMGLNYAQPEQQDEFHKLHPRMPVFGSETASTLTTRGEYGDVKPLGFMSSYDMTDGSWKPIADRDFMAGSFAWTGFDYKGEPTPFKWPNINSNFGIMDMCGFPKDNYYYYLSWWKTEPVVHVMPHWNWAGQEGKPIHVVVFSNCDSVELFLNGKSLGSKDMPRNGHLDWSVPYAPGALNAKGSTAGKITAQDTVETTGAPTAIRLKTGRTVLAADGEDVIPIEADIVDAQGRIVPTADNRVTFAVTGAGNVAGTGNGNPVDHDPDTGSNRNAFNGKCLLVVKAGETPGAIHLTANSPALTPASLEMTAR